jgi:hypothetical protein
MPASTVHVYSSREAAALRIQASYRGTVARRAVGSKREQQRKALEVSLEATREEQAHAAQEMEAWALAASSAPTETATAGSRFAGQALEETPSLGSDGRTSEEDGACSPNDRLAKDLRIGQRLAERNHSSSASESAQMSVTPAPREALQSAETTVFVVRDGDDKVYERKLPPGWQVQHSRSTGQVYPPRAPCHPHHRRSKANEIPCHVGSTGIVPGNLSSRSHGVAVSLRH